MTPLIFPGSTTLTISRRKEVKELMSVYIIVYVYLLFVVISCELIAYSISLSSLTGMAMLTEG